MNRKIVFGSLLACFLMLTIPLVPAVEYQRTNTFENIIYVDDNNTDGPWDGTQEHPYMTIQAAIGAANDGDMIYVYKGTYYENVIVDKSIKLRGENMITTIIDGDNSGTTITIDVDYVTVEGFTIQNSRIEYGYGAIDINFCNHILIKANTIKNNLQGLNVYKSITNQNITIMQNNFMNNSNYHAAPFLYLHLSDFNDNNNLTSSCSIFSEPTNFLFVKGVRHLRGKDYLAKNTNSLNINWNGNYWDDWNGFSVYQIFGLIIPFPNALPFLMIPNPFNFDLYPLEDPYNE